jgi:hypothetical protein
MFCFGRGQKERREKAERELLEGRANVLYAAIKEMRGQELADKLREHLPILVKEDYWNKSDLLDPVSKYEVLVHVQRNRKQLTKHTASNDCSCS